jgi:hypothetical protein
MANPYPMANSKLILLRESRINPHRSSSSTAAGTLLISIGGVGNGVGGTLSLAAENIPNKEDELCARDKLANDKKDWLRFVERLGTPRPVESFREGVDMAVVEEASMGGEDGMVGVEGGCFDVAKLDG